MQLPLKHKEFHPLLMQITGCSSGLGRALGLGLAAQRDPHGRPAYRCGSPSAPASACLPPPTCTCKVLHSHAEPPCVRASELLSGGA